MAAPALVNIFGVGPDTAAALLISVGNNPQRIHSEAAFASLDKKSIDKSVSDYPPHGTLYLRHLQTPPPAFSLSLLTDPDERCSMMS